MYINKIEDYFKKTKTLEKVLQDCEEDFNLIDEWSANRKNNVTDNSAEINRALNELSGSYSNLRVVLGIAQTEKKNREVRYFEQRKMEIENEGTKVNASALTAEASANVAEYRRIRNIIEAYVESAEKHIGTLQSILRDIQKDYTHPQE